MKHLRTAVASALAGLALLGACDGTPARVVIGAGDNDTADAASATKPPPALTGNDDASAPNQIPDQPSHGTCIATECPVGYDSCADFAGRLPPFPCETDLSQDDANCGICGNACSPLAGSVGMAITCIDSACRASCLEKFLDCNGIVDDGCEVQLDANDPKNCGGCGIVCADGESCVNHACGCPAGQTNCGGLCVDLDDNFDNCGQCNHNCIDNAPQDGGVMAPHTQYICGNGECNRIGCERGFESWQDCNGDLSDGCEISVAGTDQNGFVDPNNCGQCGKSCGEDRKCFDPDGNGPTCQCPTGESICIGFGPFCTDLESDPNNCGACNSFCPSPVIDGDGNGKQSCDHGHCGFTCGTGFANCNETEEDGCEADVLRDPRNCGGCGITCDLEAGQPCFNGQCLMTDCGGEVQ